MLTDALIESFAGECAENVREELSCPMLNVKLWYEFIWKTATFDNFVKQKLVHLHTPSVATPTERNFGDKEKIFSIVSMQHQISLYAATSAFRERKTSSLSPKLLVV